MTPAHRVKLMNGQTLTKNLEYAQPKLAERRSNRG